MVNQREYDIMQLESELRVHRLLEEWQRGFLGSRLPKPIDGRLEEEVPTREDVIDNSGG